MLVVYLLVARLQLSKVSFAIACLLLAVAFANLQWFTPGVDAVIAASICMAIANFYAWLIDWASEEDAHGAKIQTLPLPGSQQEIVIKKTFCSNQTHDFAVCPKETIYAVALLNDREWTALKQTIDGFSVVDRQGFYANLDYASIDVGALQDLINKHAHDVDGHILMGHVKLCLAKRQGLTPGGKLVEPVAANITDAFRHFNSALRINSEDPEALCGLLMAKGFTGLGSEHILKSLEQLLAVEPAHFHGVIAAARFLVSSTDDANNFVSTVERMVADGDDAVLPIARIMAHLECIRFVSNGANNAAIVADIYRQLRSYKNQVQELGSWQQNISNNLIAYTMQVIGDKEEMRNYLSQINGLVSPYPWKSNSAQQ